jgi:hypothetical protein
MHFIATLLKDDQEKCMLNENSQPLNTQSPNCSHKLKKMTAELNNILNTINDIVFFATSKCNSKEEVKAIDKLRAYGLIEEHVKNSLRTISKYRKT